MENYVVSSHYDEHVALRKTGAVKAAAAPAAAVVSTAQTAPA